ncbi:MAG TPA: hypothetical protein VHY36_02040 [Steroidobacteraceae bacterium]|nr:hypothetical protein [Steroidobacteraceae bacterium]
MALPLLSALPAPTQAQGISPAQAALIRNVIGARVEAMTILGGDFGLSDGSFHSTGALDGMGADVDTSVTKVGGDGDVGDPMPLGDLNIGWQPRLQGSMGYLESSDHLQARPLGGDTSELKTFAIEFGGGARFWTSQNLSFAPTVMALYGHTDNTYFAYSQFGRQDLAYLQQLGLADWSVDTWSVRPAVNVQYIVPLERALITFSSDPTGFFTHGFNRSNVREKVGGDSGLVVNKIDVDIPLDVELYGHELRSGGYLSRTDLFGDLKEGLGVEHVNEVHARLVLDFLNQLWKLQWLGVGASYLWGTNINGWTVGADVAFRF